MAPPDLTTRPEREPHPTDAPDPGYLRQIWARYLRQEAVYAHGKRRRTITVSAEGALEVAQLLERCGE